MPGKGTCRNGDGCSFSHDKDASAHPKFSKPHARGCNPGSNYFEGPEEDIASMANDMRNLGLTSAVEKHTRAIKRTHAWRQNEMEAAAAIGRILGGVQATDETKHQQQAFMAHLARILTAFSRHPFGADARLSPLFGLFGSTVSGFAMRDSDLDITLDFDTDRVCRCPPNSPPCSHHSASLAACHASGVTLGEIKT